MIRLIFVIASLMLTSIGFTGDLAFGPDHLHLSYQDGTYKTESDFIDNTHVKKRIRYVNIKIDEKLMESTEGLFYDPPFRLFQSSCDPTIAIAVNNGNGRFTSHVVLIRQGQLERIVEIPTGQGPTEMMRVGNAMLVNNDKLIVYGTRKLIAFDLSGKTAKPIASTILEKGAATSHARMGQYRDGFVLMNDTLAKSSVGKTFYYSIYTLTKNGFLFMRQGNPHYPQERILLKRPMEELVKFMKGERSPFASNTLASCIADGFREFDVYLLDFLNHALLMLSTRENRIVRYTTFDKKKFIDSWYEGQNYFCIPRFDDLKTNFFDQTVWLLNHPKMGKDKKLLPASSKGVILSDNLQEIDVLDSKLHYKETLRLVPPNKYVRFRIRTLAITGEKELTAVITIATEEALSEGKSGSSYLTRILLR